MGVHSDRNLWHCEEIEGVDECEAALYGLIGALPPHHSSTLEHLMAHFCRMCCMHEEYGHREPADRLCHVFCHVLLRPPWDTISYVSLHLAFNLSYLHVGIALACVNCIAFWSIRVMIRYRNCYHFMAIIHDNLHWLAPQLRTEGFSWSFIAHMVLMMAASTFWFWRMHCNTCTISIPLLVQERYKKLSYLVHWIMGNVLQLES